MLIIVALVVSIIVMLTSSVASEDSTEPGLGQIYVRQINTIPEPLKPLRSEVRGQLKAPQDVLVDILKQYNWNVDTAYRIMMCESGGNPLAHNHNHSTRDDSWGLFQINLFGSLKDSRPSSEWLVIPANNIDYAYNMYKRSGWTPWRNCSR